LREKTSNELASGTYQAFAMSRAIGRDSEPIGTGSSFVVWLGISATVSHCR
jgi:hypothetical protein